VTWPVVITIDAGDETAPHENRLAQAPVAFTPKASAAARTPTPAATDNRTHREPRT
jgi:hypothetical protein